MSNYNSNQSVATPRIYYKHERLFGKPIETKIINIETFNYILKHSRAAVYTGMEKTRLVWSKNGPESVYVDMFRYCTVSKDGISYDSKEHGSFYLPNAILFFDVSDHRPFPSEFYFVAKIGNQVELCRCNGGEGVSWYQLPDRLLTVDDATIITKVEETLDYLSSYIRNEVMQAEAIEKDRIATIEKRQPLSATKKVAYFELVKLCMPQSPSREKVEEFIEQLKEYDDGEGYRTTYNEFCMYLNRSSIPLIILVDWKEAVEELDAWVTAAAKENFNKSFIFSGDGKFDEDSTVSDDGLFEEFDRQLRKIDLQLSMIEPDGDEYQVVVHPAAVVEELTTILRLLV